MGKGLSVFVVMVVAAFSFADPDPQPAPQREVTCYAQGNHSEFLFSIDKTGPDSWRGHAEESLGTVFWELFMGTRKIKAEFGAVTRTENTGYAYYSYQLSKSSHPDIKSASLIVYYGQEAEDIIPGIFIYDRSQVQFFGSEIGGGQPKLVCKSVGHLKKP